MTTVLNLGLCRPNQIFKISVAYRKYFSRNTIIILFLGFYTKTIRTYAKISKEYIIGSYFYRGGCIIFFSPERLHFKAKYVRFMEMNKCMYLLIHCCNVGTFRLISDTIYIGPPKKDTM